MSPDARHLIAYLLIVFVAIVVIGWGFSARVMQRRIVKRREARPTRPTDRQ